MMTQISLCFTKISFRECNRDAGQGRYTRTEVNVIKWNNLLRLYGDFCHNSGRTFIKLFGFDACID